MSRKFLLIRVVESTYPFGQGLYSAWYVFTHESRKIIKSRAARERFDPKIWRSLRGWQTTIDGHAEEQE